MSASSIDAWHLPAGTPGGTERDEGRAFHVGRTPGGAPVRAPRLDASAGLAVAEAVRRAALRARRERSLDAIVTAAAGTAARLADPDDPLGAAAAARVAAETGWSEGEAARTLRGMADVWTSAALERSIREELGDPALLERFVPDPRRGRRLARASAPPLQLLVLAGNVPGVAVTAILRALVVRAGVLCKLPSDEPGLVPLFLRALADRDALLASTVAALWWPGEEEPGGVLRPWADACDRAVVYGGPEAVRAVRDAVGARVDVVVYGPRVGAAVFLPDAARDGTTREEAAAALARDLCAYGQRGCLSPRIVYAPAGAGNAVGEALAVALAEETASRSPWIPSPGDAMAIRAARAEYEFGEREGRRSRCLGPDTLDWSVLLQEGPGAEAGVLPRTAWIYEYESIPALLETLAPLRGAVQAMGYAGSLGLAALAEGAHSLGVARVCPVGTMAWPPADWRHEGRHQLLPLVRWTDLETPLPPG